MVLSVDSAGAWELAPAPRGISLSSPEEHCFRQSPIGERGFVKVQVISEVPVQDSNKKHKFGCIREKVRRTI